MPGHPEQLEVGHILCSEWDDGRYPRVIYPPLPCIVCGVPGNACTHDVGFLIAAQNELLNQTP